MIFFSYLLSIYVILLPLTGRYLSGYLENIFFFFPPLLFLLYLIVIKPKSILFPHPKIIFVQVILTFLFLLSCFFSKNPGVSFPQVFIWINCWLIINLFLVSQTPEKIFLSAIKITAIIYSLVYFLLKIVSLFRPIYLPTDSIFESIIPPCQLADYIIFAIPITLFFNQSKTKLLKPMVVIFFLTVILTSNSRAAIISLLLGIEIYHHFSPIRLFPKLRYFIYPLVTIFLAAYFVFPQFFYHKAGFGNRNLYIDQAIHGFLENPILGIGPANFLYTSLKYGATSSGASQFAHSSIFQYFSENGFLFTVIFFCLIVFSLIKNKQKNSLFFCLAIIGLINSTISTTGWNSPGIFIISLIFILKNFYHFRPTNKILLPSFLTASFILVFFASRNLISLHYQTTGDFYRSLNYNPFNIQSRLEIVKQFHDEINPEPFFGNDFFLFQTMAENISLPKSENIYLKTLSLNPHSDIHIYSQLFKYYTESSQTQKLNKLLESTRKNNDETIYSYQLYLESLITNTPFPQNENYYYQLFNIIKPDILAQRYFDLINNYTKSDRFYPQVSSLLYIIKNNFQHHPGDITINRIFADKMLTLSIKLWQLGQKEIGVGYIKTAIDFNPSRADLKVQLASNLYFNNWNWKSTQVIYDCANKDPSPFVRFECHIHLGRYSIE